MKIVEKRQEKALQLELEGHLDTNTAPELQTALEDLDGIEDLQLDFSKLEYVSSAGLRVLLIAAKQMKAKNCKLVIHNVNTDIMDVFIITGFNDILTIE